MNQQFYPENSGTKFGLNYMVNLDISLEEKEQQHLSKANSIGQEWIKKHVLTLGLRTATGATNQRSPLFSITFHVTYPLKLSDFGNE